MVAAGAISKQINNEKYMLPVSYGAMLVETLVAVLALIAVGSLAWEGRFPSGTPVIIFATGVSTFLYQIGLPIKISFILVSLAVSSFVLTTLDTVARLGRLAFQELFYSEKDSASKKSNRLTRTLASKPVASLCTILPAYVLAIIGYQNIWPLFGAANQLLAALTLIACALFFKKTKRRGFMLFIPACIMLIVTFTSLILTIKSRIPRILDDRFCITADGLQALIAAMLLILGVLIVIFCGLKMKEDGAGKPGTGA
jgi:carbon starvation protein